MAYEGKETDAYFERPKEEFINAYESYDFVSLKKTG